MRILAILLVLFLMACNAAAAKRVALVIGNGNYSVQPKLRNPVGDATAIAKVLRDAGFIVTLGTDLTNQAMRETINRFAVTVPDSDAALLYFAGHGVQVDGENYLIPVDANIERVADLVWQTIPVSTLVSELEGQGRTSIVILDACRHNAGLTRRLRGLTSRSRSLSVGQGLAQVSAPDGAYIAFSTAPHTVARDGIGKNSPFATALLKHMPTPGLDIALMMRRVRSDVRRMTKLEQTPWDSSSLTQPFYFVPKAQPAAAPAAPAPAPATRAPSRLSARDAFAETRSIGTCQAYDYFLRAYPSGFLSNLARAWKDKNCVSQHRNLGTVSPPALMPPLPASRPGQAAAKPRPKPQSTSRRKPKASERKPKQVKKKRLTSTPRSRSSRKPSTTKARRSKSCFTDCVAACIILRDCEWRCNRKCS